MKRNFLPAFIVGAFFFSILTTAEAGRPQRSLVITSPSPYETIRTGISIPVTWEASNVGNLNLYYRDRQTGTKNLIRENIPTRVRQASWAIPSTLSSGEYDLILEDQFNITSHTIQVKLENVSSRRTFPKADEMITVTSPNGGETFLYGYPVRVSWSHSGLGNKGLDILLGAPNINGQISWTYLASDIPGNWDGYTWIPDKALIDSYLQQNGITNPRFKILILDRSNRNVKDTSDGYFMLRTPR